MAKEDKLKALDAAIAQIEKQYGKNTGKELVEYILDAKGVSFRELLPDVYKNKKYSVIL